MVTRIILSDKMYESDFKFPYLNGLAEPIFGHESKSKRIKTNMDFEVTFTYEVEDFYSKDVYDVYKANGKCILETDGLMQPQELYQAYQAMEKEFLKHLAIKHRNASIPLLKELHLTPYEKIAEELKGHTRKFLS